MLSPAFQSFALIKEIDLDQAYGSVDFLTEGNEKSEISSSKQLRFPTWMRQTPKAKLNRDERIHVPPKFHFQEKALE